MMGDPAPFRERAALRSSATCFATAMILVLCGCSSGGGDAGPSADANPQPDSSPSPDEQLEPVSALFVLGDSLSDIGNAASLVDFALDKPVQPSTVGLCNPTEVLILERSCDDLFYGRSRVSDGAVAIEHLAESFELEPLRPSLHLLPSRSMVGTVYAVAGGKARGPTQADLDYQIDRLLLDSAPLPVDAVVVVMIGGNDVIDAIQAIVADDIAAAATSAAIVTSAVDAIGEGVERLLDFGARRFIVANVPDLAALPAVRADAAANVDEAGTLAAASAISEDFDRQLGARLDDIEARGQWNFPVAPEIARFDLRAALAAAQLELAAGGGNALDACFDSAAYRDSAVAERIFHPDCAPGSGEAPRFDDFVFWDLIHPTGTAHAAIGAALIDAAP
jgi:lysophospholipase L1-like esterase